MLFPENKELFYLGEDKGLLANLSANGINKSQHLLKIIKENGYVDYSNSIFNAEKSSHCWVFTKSLTAFSIQTSWYKEKITLTSFEPIVQK
jgi:hypothetical protein